MSGHAERAHALLSASSAHRWLACTPSARLEEQFPDTTSEAAREGTLAHELAELKLRHYFFTVDFGRAKFTRAVNKLKKQELWKDEMDRHTEEYLDYVRSVALAYPSEPHVDIERRWDLTAYVPEGFGTADCTMISGRQLHVIDFKYGKGVPVSAEKNPQLMLYALGAYEAYKILYPVDSVRLSIVQPRLPDSNSEWSCTLGELLEFGTYVKERAALAMKGEGEFAPGAETCRFCRAKAHCRARADWNIRLAFQVGKKPPLISNAEMGEYLRQGEDVAKWLSDLKDLALSECLAGREVPGWKAVEGRSQRAFTDMDAAFEALKQGGIAEEILWERKPLTLAQVEKAVGKKPFAEMVGSLVVKQPGKPALVPESDKREAITSKASAEEAFSGIMDKNNDINNDINRAVDKEDKK